jgi:hypothetical protein
MPPPGWPSKARIALRRQRLSAQDLRRNVGLRAVQQGAGAETGQPHLPAVILRRKEYVARFNILMKHADAVRGCHGID